MTARNVLWALAAAVLGAAPVAADPPAGGSAATGAAVSSGDAGMSAAIPRTWWPRSTRTGSTSGTTALDMTDPFAELT